MPQREATDAEVAAQIRLGDAVGERRLELELSRKQAAEQTRMHRNYYNMLERGEINPTYRTLLRVATGLELTLDQLVARAQPEASDDQDD